MHHPFFDEISLTKDTVECVFFNVSYLKFVKACGNIKNF